MQKGNPALKECEASLYEIWILLVQVVNAAIDDWNESSVFSFVGIDTMGGSEDPQRVHQCRPADVLSAASFTQTTNVGESPHRRFIALVASSANYSVSKKRDAVYDYY